MYAEYCLLAIVLSADSEMGCWMTKEILETFLKDLFETPLFVGAAIQESIVVFPNTQV
jgi:hypothetical protein